ncbi:3'5'-cyclic nucleotide phosphodiesterase domain-containing protein [Besnoitia besnoiti]|uniref:Phosphodiesterase n=1 Tax=Besnoitia besnoiti TaxID=94643 RepID=A0A2A9M3Y3_BESBE|nr:3'5'-cyclic nucleotide phosphodiesterase domain-containing protein [Besnoitia besnoiti]PFH33198.1 3'5'-cyclic nucleotide phosphodiesterase domain-containing protein [Besnoitia besnoiti]
MLPVSMRFEDPRDEDKFAANIQHQLQRNIWWTVSIPVCSLLFEFAMTCVSTPDFSPRSRTPQLLYTVGTFTLVTVFGLLFVLSHISAFLPLLESCLCISGCLYSFLLPLLCDHYRVAALLGLSPQETWGRESFSDGPVLMALTALLFSVAIFIPVRDICLWPVCLVAVASFQTATLLTGGADGLRPSIINGLLLMLLAYLALVGRRALELQLRLQCEGMLKAQASVEALRTRLEVAASLPPPPAPPTALESVMNALDASLERMGSIRLAVSSNLHHIAPGLGSPPAFPSSLSAFVRARTKHTDEASGRGPPEECLCCLLPPSPAPACVCVFPQCLTRAALLWQAAGSSFLVAPPIASANPFSALAFTAGDLAAGSRERTASDETPRNEDWKSVKESPADTDSAQGFHGVLHFLLSPRRRSTREAANEQGTDRRKTLKRRSLGLGDEEARHRETDDGGEEADGARDEYGDALASLWGTWMSAEIDRVMADVQGIKRQLGNLGGLLKVDVNAILRASLPEDSPSISYASSPALSPASASASSASPEGARSSSPERPPLDDRQLPVSAAEAPQRLGLGPLASPPASIDAASAQARALFSLEAGGTSRFATGQPLPPQSVSVPAHVSRSRERGRKASSAAFRRFVGSEMIGTQGPSFQPSASSFVLPFEGAARYRATPHSTDVHLLADTYAALRAKNMHEVHRTERGLGEASAHSHPPPGENPAAARALALPRAQKTRAERTASEAGRKPEDKTLGEASPSEKGSSSSDKPGGARRPASPQERRERNRRDGKPSSSPEKLKSVGKRGRMHEEGLLKNKNDQETFALPSQHSRTEDSPRTPTLLGRGGPSPGPPPAASILHRGSSLHFPPSASPSLAETEGWGWHRRGNSLAEENANEATQLREANAPVYFYIGDEDEDGTGCSTRSLSSLASWKPQRPAFVSLADRLPADSGACLPCPPAFLEDAPEASEDATRRAREGARHRKASLPADAPSPSRAHQASSAWPEEEPGRVEATHDVRRVQTGRWEVGEQPTIETRDHKEGPEYPGGNGRLLERQISTACASYLPLHQLAAFFGATRFAALQHASYMSLPLSPFQQREGSLTLSLDQPAGSPVNGAAADSASTPREAACARTDTSRLRDVSAGGRATESPPRGGEGAAGESDRERRTGTEWRRPERRRECRGEEHASSLHEPAYNEASASDSAGSLRWPGYPATQTCERRLERLRQCIGVCWALDPVQLHACSGERALQTVGAELLCLSPSICAFFRLSSPFAREPSPALGSSAFLDGTSRLLRSSLPALSFLEALARGYHASASYHNSMHAADVAHMLRCLLRMPAPSKRLPQTGPRCPAPPCPAAASSAASGACGVARRGDSAFARRGRNGARARETGAGGDTRLPETAHQEVAPSAAASEGDGTLWGLLTPAQKAASVVAALAHDVGHPGTTNAFEMNRRSLLALTYNDNSVLEQFHSSVAFFLLHHHQLLLPVLPQPPPTLQTTPTCTPAPPRRGDAQGEPPADGPPPAPPRGEGAPDKSEAAGDVLDEDVPLADRIQEEEAYRAFRREVIELIVHTDMSKHFSLLALFKVKRQSGSLDVTTSEEDRSMLLKMLLKAADIGHAAKAFDLHFFLSCCLIEEFHRQGDEERRRGMAISPLCDRRQARRQIFSSQAGFLQVVCLDFFAELAQAAADLARDRAAQHEQQKTYPVSSPFPASASPLRDAPRSADDPPRRRRCGGPGGAPVDSEEGGKVPEGGQMPRQSLPSSFAALGLEPRVRRQARGGDASQLRRAGLLGLAASGSPGSVAPPPCPVFASEELPDERRKRRAPARSHPTCFLSEKESTKLRFPSASGPVALPPQSASAAAAVGFSSAPLRDAGAPPSAPTTGLCGNDRVGRHRPEPAETPAAAAGRARGGDPGLGEGVSAVGARRRAFSFGLLQPSALRRKSDSGGGAEKGGRTYMRSLSSFFRSPKPRKEGELGEERARQRRSQTLPSSLLSTPASRFAERWGEDDRGYRGRPREDEPEAQEEEGNKAENGQKSRQRRERSLPSGCSLTGGVDLDEDASATEAEGGGRRVQGQTSCEAAADLSDLRGTAFTQAETHPNSVNEARATRDGRRRGEDDEKQEISQGEGENDDEEDEERTCDWDLCNVCQRLSRRRGDPEAQPSVSPPPSLLQNCVEQIQLNKRTWEAMVEGPREPPCLLPTQALFGPHPLEGVGGLVRRHLGAASVPGELEKQNLSRWKSSGNQA